MESIFCSQCRHVNPVERSTCARCGSQLNRPEQGFDPLHTPSQEEPSRFRRGQIFANRYVIQEIVGRGGMGIIYKVHDNTLKETAALKTLLPELVQDQLVVERFFNEARIARSLSHPNIVRVHDIGNAENIIFISMEFLQGKSLRDVLDGLIPGQRIGMKTVLRIFGELCASLEYAHRFTVHRDIKPENVMIVEEGKVKLMDFGISKLMTATNLTAASMVMGTPHYMSPEQLKNSAGVDGRADIYSVGVMLYEVLTGNTPAGVPRPASEITHDVPPALDTILEKCLNPDPDQRYRNAGELREALGKVRQMVEAGSELVEKTQKVESTRTTMTVSPKAVPILLLVCIVLATGAGLWKVETDRRLLPTPAPVVGQQTASARLATENDELEIILDEFAALANNHLPANDLHAEWLGRAEGLRKDANSTWDDAPNVASASAYEAISFYAGVLHKKPGMIYIPGGQVVLYASQPNEKKVSIPGFLIDATPVTARRFNAFSQSNGWRWPRGVPPSDAPMTSVTYYDAQAYAAAQSASTRLPGHNQWLRAATYGQQKEILLLHNWQDSKGADEEALSTPFELISGLSEWTRTPRGNVSQTPWFESNVFIAAGTLDADDAIAFAANSTSAFHASYNALGFRCVYELPTTVAEARAFLNAIKESL